jgi:hypothetical protein
LEGKLGIYYRYSGILMHDQLMIDYSNGYQAPTIAAFRRMVGMHEFGHYIDILDVNPDGSENYCDNIYCCMHEAYVVKGIT